MKISVSVSLLINEPVRATVDAGRLSAIIRLAQEVGATAGRSLTTDGSLQLIDVNGNKEQITTIVSYLTDMGIYGFNVQGEYEEVLAIKGLITEKLNTAVTFTATTPPMKETSAPAEEEVAQQPSVPGEPAPEVK
jgi:hypothetical protein